MPPLRFALFGTGFWSRFQLAAWQEVGGVECVALANRTADKAVRVADDLGLRAHIYTDPEALLANEQLDFVDVVSSVETHGPLVHLAAAHGLPVICQKPLADDWRQVQNMVRECERRALPFFVHENWRWQAPIRKVKQLLLRPEAGPVYRGRLRMVSSFPIFENQPSLKTLERFLVMDMGSHILDVVRFLFGEPASIYCTLARVRPDIQGEDVATIILRTATNATIVCELGYAGTPLEHDHFPQTVAFIECRDASIELGPHYCVRLTTKRGTETLRAAPARYEWSDHAYEVVHASIVDCHRDLLAGLRGQHEPETSAADNLKTMRLVFSAYDSAQTNRVIEL